MEFARQGGFKVEGRRVVSDQTRQSDAAGELEESDDLLTVFTALLADGKSIRTELEKERQEYARVSERSRSISKLLIFVMIGCLVVSMASVTLLIFSRERGELIKSCTTPQGDCYQRNQEAQEKAVAYLAQEQRRSIEVYVKCARSTSTDAALDACVERRLKEGAP
jgi:hypothetical protein